MKTKVQDECFLFLRSLDKLLLGLLQRASSLCLQHQLLDPELAYLHVQRDPLVGAGYDFDSICRFLLDIVCSFRCQIRFLFITGVT